MSEHDAMIEIQLQELLKAQARTFYWLAKVTGISHTTLWRLKRGNALGINFATLEKLCLALDCQPGEIFAVRKVRKRSTDKR